MNPILQSVLVNWKSTLQSVLTTVFAITGALMVSNVVSHKTAAIMTGINAVAKIVIGAMQTDGVNVPPGSKITQETTVTTPISPTP